MESKIFFSVLAYNYGIPVSLSVNSKQIVCQEDALARKTNANVLKKCKCINCANKN